LNVVEAQIALRYVADVVCNKLRLLELTKPFGSRANENLKKAYRDEIDRLDLVDAVGSAEGSDLVRYVAQLLSSAYVFEGKEAVSYTNGEFYWLIAWVTMRISRVYGISSRGADRTLQAYVKVLFDSLDTLFAEVKEAHELDPATAKQATTEQLKSIVSVAWKFSPVVVFFPFWHEFTAHRPFLEKVLRLFVLMLVYCGAVLNVALFFMYETDFTDVSPLEVFLPSVIVTIMYVGIFLYEDRAVRSKAFAAVKLESRRTQVQYEMWEEHVIPVSNFIDSTKDVCAVYFTSSSMPTAFRLTDLGGWFNAMGNVAVGGGSFDKCARDVAACNHRTRESPAKMATPARAELIEELKVIVDTPASPFGGNGSAVVHSGRKKATNLVSAVLCLVYVCVTIIVRASSEYSSAFGNTWSRTVVIVLHLFYGYAALVFVSSGLLHDLRVFEKAVDQIERVAMFTEARAARRAQMVCFTDLTYGSNLSFLLLRCFVINNATDPKQKNVHQHYVSSFARCSCILCNVFLTVNSQILCTGSG
jgi:hypothetical protein